MKLKKAAIVGVAAAGMVLAGSPAIAAPVADDTQDRSVSVSQRGGNPYEVDVDDWPTYGDAFEYFVEGGGALGWGAAAVIAGAYTGIALTPALVAHSFSD